MTPEISELVLLQRLRAAERGGLREEAYTTLCGDAADALTRSSERTDHAKRMRFERDVAVAAMREIKRATLEGRVCADVAWFDQMETLHDFCDRILASVSGSTEGGNG